MEEEYPKLTLLNVYPKLVCLKLGDYSDKALKIDFVQVAHK